MPQPCASPLLLLLAACSCCSLLRSADAQNSLCIGKRHAKETDSPDYLACDDRNPKTSGKWLRGRDLAVCITHARLRTARSAIAVAAFEGEGVCVDWLSALEAS